jgi:hypothetical protein
VKADRVKKWRASESREDEGKLRNSVKDEKTEDSLKTG